MENYIVINGVTYDLVERTGMTPVGDDGRIVAGPKLEAIPVKATCKIGSHELVVMKRVDGATYLLRKKSLGDSVFGDSNNYNGATVDEMCNNFAKEIAAIVGEENMVEFTVDLTADDGLKCYGSIQRKAALLTANQCREYVDILDEYKLDEYWWAATAYSTPKHDDSTWVKCVSPFGTICYFNCNFRIGVRPFCILKSHIFVS